VLAGAAGPAEERLAADDAPALRGHAHGQRRVGERLDDVARDRALDGEHRVAVELVDALDRYAMLAVRALDGEHRVAVERVDELDRYAMLAVQGPVARDIVQALADSPLPVRMTPQRRSVVGREALLGGTGRTGED